LWYAAGIGASGIINDIGVPFVEERVLGRLLTISQDGFVVMSRKGWVG
jgi:hypothetical protein